jgi:hypothetical protein
MGHSNLYCASRLPRSVSQCQPVCATNAESTIVPIRSGHASSKQRIERRNRHDEHEQLAKLDADVERQQRRQHVTARELQRITKRK